MTSTAEKTLTFEINGEHAARISAKPWSRSLVGPDHLTVEHDGRAYVVAITLAGFEAFPIRAPGDPVNGDVAVGDRVSYEDQKNPRRVGVVVEILPAGQYRIEWVADDESAVSDLLQPGWRFA